MKYLSSRQNITDALHIIARTAPHVLYICLIILCAQYFYMFQKERSFEVSAFFSTSYEGKYSYIYVLCAAVTVHHHRIYIRQTHLSFEEFFINPYICQCQRNKFLYVHKGTFPMKNACTRAIKKILVFEFLQLLRTRQGDALCPQIYNIENQYMIIRTRTFYELSFYFIQFSLKKNNGNILEYNFYKVHCTRICLRDFVFFA